MLELVDVVLEEGFEGRKSGDIRACVPRGRRTGSSATDKLIRYGLTLFN